MFRHRSRIEKDVSLPRWPKCKRTYCLRFHLRAPRSPSTLRIHSTSACWTYEILHKMPPSSSSVCLDQKLWWFYWHPALRENKRASAATVFAWRQAGCRQPLVRGLQVILHSWNDGEHTFWLSDADCFLVCQIRTNRLDPSDVAFLKTV